ncbi:MAG TPA: thiamine pyrophosphate-dependent enzyme, partial [Chroococcales cyanobacterium]
PLWGDLCELARPVTKRTFELKTPSEIPRLVRRAFHEAMSPPRAPVFISMPVDILLSASEQNAITPPSSSPLGAADTAFLRKAAKTLVAARQPCIIVGNEVSLFRARKEAVTLAEVVGCPVYCEPLPTGVNFPNRHPHYAGVLPLDLHKASAKLRGFDVILVLGMQTRVPAKHDEPNLISDGSSVIQINVEPGLAGRTLPCFMSANADIAESLSRLRAEIQLIVDSGWVNAAKQRARVTIGEIANARQELEDQVVYPSPNSAIPLVWLLRLLDASRPRTSIVVNDLVSANADPLDILNLEGSSSYFGSNGGIAGHGMAAALGVQWATPESPVVCITSDSSTLYYPQVLWTASHYGLHVKFVVVNTMGRNTFNLRLAQIPLSDGRMILDNPAISLPEMARSMRVQGATVTTMNSLEPALHKMFETPGPFLLDVHVGESAS